MARTVRVRRGKRSKPAIRRRRTLRRFRRNRRNRSTISKMPGTIVADRMLTKVKYTNTVWLTSFSTPSDDNSLGAYSYQDMVIYSTNPYQPYGVIATDLPAGLTIWSQLYSEVAVTRLSVKVVPIAFETDITNNSHTLPYSITITAIPQSTSVPNINSAVIDFMEQPYNRHKYFTQGPNRIVISQSGSLMYSAQEGYQVEQYVKNTMTSKRMLGYKNLFDQDQDTIWYPTRQSANSNAASWYFIVTVKSSVPWDGTSPVGAFTMAPMLCRIELEYSLAFRNRRPILEEQ